MISPEECVLHISQLEHEFWQIALPEEGLSARYLYQVYGMLAWELAGGVGDPEEMKRFASRLATKLAKKGKWDRRQRCWRVFGECWVKALKEQGKLTDRDARSYENWVWVTALLRISQDVPTPGKDCKQYTDEEIQQLLNPLPPNAC